MARTLGVAVLLVALQTQSTLSRAWRTVQDLVIERPGVIGVTLPEETLDAARPALEDLRILDPTGKEVPWTIEVHTHTPTAARRPAQMHTLLHPESTEVLLATESDAPVAGVELTVASEDFVKAARVEESADGRTWKVVREDEVLFRSPGGPGKTSLELPPLPRAHLRVILDDRRSRPVPVTGVTLLGASPAPPATEPLEIEVTERREEQGETRFFLRFSGRHARLAEISLETPEPVFTRPAELSQAAGESREFLSLDRSSTGNRWGTATCRAALDRSGCDPHGEGSGAFSRQRRQPTPSRRPNPGSGAPRAPRLRRHHRWPLPPAGREFGGGPSEIRRRGPRRIGSFPDPRVPGADPRQSRLASSRAASGGTHPRGSPGRGRLAIPEEGGPRTG